MNGQARALWARLFVWLCLAVGAAAPFAADGADISLKMSQKGLAVVDLAINGEGPFPMVLDTGAGITTVTTKLAEELNLMRMGRMPQPVELAGGPQTVDLYTMGYVTLAGDKAPAPITIILDEPFKYIREARGILGMNVLARFSLDIDQPGKRLILRDAGSVPAAGDDWSRAAVAKRWDNFLVVDVVIDGVKAQAVLDTGSNKTIVNAALSKQLGIAIDTADDTADKVTLADDKTHKGHVKNLQLAAASWSDLDVEAVDLPLFKTLGLGDGPAMILGNDALKQVRLFVDYQGGQVFLTQPADAPLVGAR